NRRESSRAMDASSCSGVNSKAPAPPAPSPEARRSNRGTEEPRTSSDMIQRPPIRPSDLGRGQAARATGATQAALFVVRSQPKEAVPFLVESEFCCVNSEAIFVKLTENESDGTPPPPEVLMFE